MRTRLLLALVLLLVATATHAQDIKPAWLEVADVNLRLREGPSTDDDVITQLTPREAVELLHQGEAWSHIRRQDGTAGWAHNDYLLPWDERNRPDTLRRVGERRLFRVAGSSGGLAHAELRLVSSHSYIYTVARRTSDPLPDDDALLRLGQRFDEQTYRQALDLWNIRNPPHIDGDQRIPVLVASGFDEGSTLSGWYSGRDGMPNDAGSGTGFIGLSVDRDEERFLGKLFTVFFSGVVAHEFGHLLHHHVGDRNGASWVREGLATFTARFIGPELDKVEPVQFYLSGFVVPDTQLNLPWNPSYYASSLFMTYLFERFGAEFLRDFASHPRQGLAALDSLLGERNEVLRADDIFADWVIANYLLDGRRGGGRFGYKSPDLNTHAPPAPLNEVRSLPTGLRDSTAPYTAKYYELPMGQEGSVADRLLLDLRLNMPEPQDAWLQVVQVLPDTIDVQRFRASDYRGRPMLARLDAKRERIFVVLSPFTPGERERTRPVSFSLALREQAPVADRRAQVTAALRVRRAAHLEADTIGRLRPCSFVQVLQRNAEWSRVQDESGLTGWSHNDYLFHLDAPGAGASASACAGLVRAAHDGDLSALFRHLAAGADVNASDAFGRHALHEAAMWGHADVVASLLRAGADVQLQDSAGQTPLDEAFRSGDLRSIQLLQDAGAGFDLADHASLPLLIEAAGSGNISLLNMILAEGHDINWHDEGGRTALAAAALNGQFSALHHLLANEAATDIADADGRSPLMLAAAHGHIGTLQLLHSAGAEVNRTDREGHSALTLAAANGHTLAVAALLLGGEADIHHSLPDTGRNALHLAAAAGHEDVLAMLLLKNIDTRARDAGGRTARQLALANGHERAALYLRMAQTASSNPHARLTEEDIGAFVAAAHAGDLAEVERILDSSGRIYNVFGGEPLSALTNAAISGHQDVVLRLLFAGANQYMPRDIDRDHPILYYTVHNGHDKITAMLLLGGAPPVTRVYTTRVLSALLWAADFGREDIVHLLLNMGLNVNLRNHVKETPLEIAVRNQHASIVEVLLAAGANPNHRDFFSMPMLHHARQSGNEQIISLLLAAGAEA